MSGQPVRTPADVNRYRDKYMDTLKMQEDINQMNLQANKTYLLTGQLPPQSQMQDTRTVAEKLADVEKLKHEIASNFKPIAEPQTAYQVITKLMSDPLNANNSLLRFVAQRITSLVEQIKKIMPYGMAGDINDIDRIVEYLKSMYSEQQGKFQSTKSYMNSVSSGSTSSKLISSNDIDNVIIQVQDIMKNLILLANKGFLAQGEFRMIDDLGRGIFNHLQILKEVLPTSQEMNEILNDLEDPEVQTLTGALLSSFYDIMEQMPKYNDIMALINKSKQYIKYRNLSAAKDSFRRLEDLFSFIDNNNIHFVIDAFKQLKDKEGRKIKSKQFEKMQAFNQEKERIDEEIMNYKNSKKVGIVNPPTVDEAFIAQQSTGMFRNPKAIPDAVHINNPSLLSTDEDETKPKHIIPSEEEMDDLYYEEPKNKEREEKVEEKKQPIIDEDSIFYILENRDEPTAKAILKGRLENISKKDEKDGTNIFGEIVNKITNITGATYNFPDKTPHHIKADTIKNLLFNLYKYDEWNENKPLGIVGLGIKKKRGRPRGAGVVVVKPPNFVGFGINEINRKNLEKGVLTVRRNTRTNYPDMPSRHISQNLRNVIKTMIGGGAPKYEELGKLDNDEKEYLYKLVSRSNMEDKLSVPAPSKDQQEKDIHNFEVMKGQILSGNDSVDMVKKFKLLIRKLARQGLLPKADVEDMMDVLTDLGY